MKFSKIKLPSNRKFGFLFTAIFFLASIYAKYIGSEVIVYLLSAICGIFLIITLINADILLPLNKLWMKIGILIGMIVNPIIMGIIFFGIFTPISILIRFSGRDELRLILKKKKTHWIYRKSIKRFDLFKKQY